MPPKRKNNSNSSKRSKRAKKSTTPKARKTPISKKNIPVDNSDSEDDVDEHGNLKGLIDYDYKPGESDESQSEESQSESESTDGSGNPFADMFILHQIFGNMSGGPKSKSAVLRQKISSSKMSQSMKDKLIAKLESTSLDEKQKEWFDTITSIPFGVYNPIPVDVERGNVGEYFKSLLTTLDKAVYGMKTVKEEIINYVAQCISNSKDASSAPSPRILALHGVAGVGKTKLIREGISKALNRPMHSFSMGGIKDSQYFVGFDYTYVNSKQGAIVQSIIDGKVMNPVLFFDELDKISEGSEGKEIENLLIHMTDPVQNHDFRDKYFDGYPIDLSKCIFIFAFNDIENINPVLRDRLHVINIPAPSMSDKIFIAKNYLIDELLQNIKLDKSDFSISDDVFKTIIDKYAKNDGVRSLKRCIETLLLKVNTIKLLGSSIRDMNLSFSNEDVSLPVSITQKNIHKFLSCHSTKEDEPKNPYMYL